MILKKIIFNLIPFDVFIQNLLYQKSA